MAIGLSLRRPVSLILHYAGENPDVSGGTMGEPNELSPSARILHNRLLRILLQTGEAYFHPCGEGMWSKKEWCLRCLAHYLLAAGDQE